MIPWFRFQRKRTSQHLHFGNWNADLEIDDKAHGNGPFDERSANLSEGIVKRFHIKNKPKM